MSLLSVDPVMASTVSMPMHTSSEWEEEHNAIGPDAHLPGVVGLVPAARLCAPPGDHKALQAPKEALVGAARIQDAIPGAADNAVVALERGAVVRAMRAPGHQQARCLRREPGQDFKPEQF